MIGLPDRVRTDCVDATVNALEPGGTVCVDAADACFDALDDGDLQALVGACIEGFEIAAGADKPVHVVLDDLEEMVAIVDPDEDEAGAAEETEYLARIAEALTTPDGTNALPGLVGAVLGWDADFARG